MKATAHRPKRPKPAKCVNCNFPDIRPALVGARCEWCCWSCYSIVPEPIDAIDTEGVHHGE